MYKIIIETDKIHFKDTDTPKLNTSGYYLIKKFSEKMAMSDWKFLCRRKDFLDAVSDGDYNKVKDIAKNNLVTI